MATRDEAMCAAGVEPCPCAAATLLHAADQDDTISALRAFAQEVMECWPMGDLDGGTLQDAAVKHGLLKPETRHEPCGEGCSCAEYADAQEWEGGVVCYRKTPLLKGSNDQAKGPGGFLPGPA